MLAEDIKDIQNGRIITTDGGVGSGIKGHITPEQKAAMKERLLKKTNKIDNGVAQAEFNIGYKAFRKGEKKNPPSNIEESLKKIWVQGYEAAEKAKKKDQEENEDWHEEQRSRAYRGQH